MTTTVNVQLTATAVLIVLIMVLAVPSPSFAADTYYVSASSGNDVNDGLSPVRAWQHLSKIYLKSVSQNPFRPGDSILLKRGDQWDGQIRLQANGTAQRPIRLAAYGEGAKPFLFGDNPLARWETVTGDTGVYTAEIGDGGVAGAVFLDGKPLKTVYPRGSLNSYADIKKFVATLQPDTQVGRFGSRLWIRLTGPRNPSGSIRLFRNAGVSIDNSSYVELENLDIERFYIGIDVTTSRLITVQHNDIENVIGIGIYLRADDSHCLVQSNTVHRSGDTALYVLKGVDNTFRDNWVSQVPADIEGIHVTGDGMGIGLQESRQSLVEHNYFIHSGGIDFYHEVGSIIRYNYLYRVSSAGSPNGTNLSVYGNIYNLGGSPGKQASTGVNISVTGPGTITFFNNTIVNARAFSLMSAADNQGKIVFTDNIVSSTNGENAMTAYGVDVISDHNCFFTTGVPVFGYRNARLSSLKGYQDESGLDQKSIFGDPRFKSLHPITPLDVVPGRNSACNSSALPPPCADCSSRTYDHDTDNIGAPIIGALRARYAPPRSDSMNQSCMAHCFDQRFAVSPGVYLVTVTLASAMLNQKSIFTFFLNSRRIVLDLNYPDLADGGGAPVRCFIVRTEGAWIALDADTDTDPSLVARVDIRTFDTAHGDGTQIIAW